jgi:hypothetical protein
MISISLANRDDIPEIHEEELEIIAGTLISAVVCIGVGKNNFGKIYQFEVAMETLLLANNLTEFLNGLQN